MELENDESRICGKRRSIGICEFRIDVFVEKLGPLNLVAAADTDRPAQAPAELGADGAAGKIEARSNLLLQRPGEKGVRGGAEHPRLTIGADHAVFAEALSTSSDFEDCRG